MKSIFALAALFVGHAAFACPDFSGKYKVDDSQMFQVVQTGCSSIRLKYNTGILSPTVDVEFKIDGRRHKDDLGIWWSAYWAGDNFVRESYSTETGDERTGDRAIWSLRSESGASEIFEQMVYPEDGSVISERTYSSLR